MWAALTELVRSYAAYYRAQAQNPQHPPRAREGVAAWLTGVGTILAAVLAFVAAVIFLYQLEIMSDTEQRQLRAYVFVEQAVETNFGGSEAPVFHVDLKNGGQTPAYHMRVWVGTDEDLFPARRAKTMPKMPQQFPTVLGPGGYLHGMIPTRRPLTDAETSDIKEGSAAIYGFGEATYEDVFGHHHFTRFKLYYGGDAGVHPDGLMKPTGANDNEAN
jgi:hypothetical protein